MLSKRKMEKIQTLLWYLGGLCALWFCIWKLTVADTPEKDRFITKMEKNFLTEINRQQDSLVKTVSLISDWNYLNIKISCQGNASF